MSDDLVYALRCVAALVCICSYLAQVIFCGAALVGYWRGNKERAADSFLASMGCHGLMKLSEMLVGNPPS